jgi:hypothetical protein
MSFLWRDIGLTILAENSKNPEKPKNLQNLQILWTLFFLIIWTEMNSKYIFLFVMTSRIRLCIVFYFVLI